MNPHGVIGRQLTPEQVEAIETWQAKNDAARDAYYGNDAAEYARRLKASDKSKRRYRARKDSSK